MNRSWLQFLVVPIIILGFVSGCATTKPHRPEPAQDPQRQIMDLQNQLQTKDQQIQDLQYQVDNGQQALPSSNFASSSGDKGDIRVAGVTAKDVQKALAKAGYDPGPSDGRFGKKTKKAIKSFQKKQGLTADGIVGERTWAALR